MPADVYSLDDNKALYAVLGVAPSASLADIKKAYKTKALQHHPDRGGDEDTFKQLAFAYNILSDEDQRRKYDGKTLKQSLSTEARQRDPEMDPDVELEGEQLRSFVERLHSEQMENLRKKAEFERKREEEYRRRAEYDLKHGPLSMSSSSPAFASSPAAAAASAASAASAAAAAAAPSFGSYSSPFLAEALRGHSGAVGGGVPGGRTSADMLASLQARMGGSQQQQQENAALPPATPDFAAKRAMMDRFRADRHASGIAPCVVDEKTKSTLQSAAASHKFGFVKEASKDAYDYDVDTVRKRAGFDYKKFVQDYYHDGGVIKEAVLADALEKYDNKNPSAGLD